MEAENQFAIRAFNRFLFPDRPQTDSKVIPNRSQTDPKPTPNRSQTDPKAIPNRFQTEPTVSLGVSLDVLSCPELSLAVLKTVLTCLQKRLWLAPVVRKTLGLSSP